jgi:hypothetical protein
MPWKGLFLRSRCVLASTGSLVSGWRFGDVPPGVEGSLVDEGRLSALQSLRRQIAKNPPDGPAKETFLYVLDQMISDEAEELTELS